MYRETKAERLSREIRPLKLKDKVAKLWDALRDSEEELRTTENKLHELADAAQEIVLFGATETGLAELNET